MQAFYAKGGFKKTWNFQLKPGRAMAYYTEHHIVNLPTARWFKSIEITKKHNCTATVHLCGIDWLPIQTIDIDYQLALKSQRGEEHDVVVHVEKQFSGTNKSVSMSNPYLSNHWRFSKPDNIVSVSILILPDYLQVSSGFLDDNGKLNLEYSIGIKNTVAFDTIDMIDLFRSDPLINDHEVCINGVTYFVSKPMIGFQSMLFHLCLEAKSFEVFATYNDEDIHVFLQILHGVDLPLSITTVKGVMQMADKFKVARVTELCIQYLINGKDSKYMDRLKIAIEFGHDEVFLGLINSAKNIRQLRDQQWDCHSLSKTNSVLLGRRLFELSVML